MNGRQRVLLCYEFLCRVCGLRVLHAYDAWCLPEGEYVHRSCTGRALLAQEDGYRAPEGSEEWYKTQGGGLVLGPTAESSVERPVKEKRSYVSSRNYLGVDKDEYEELKKWKESQATGQRSL